MKYRLKLPSEDFTPLERWRQGNERVRNGPLKPLKRPVAVMLISDEMAEAIAAYPDNVRVCVRLPDGVLKWEKPNRKWFNVGAMIDHIYKIGKSGLPIWARPWTFDMNIPQGWTDDDAITEE
jgi:hypothetical protein